jgi:hypothetical protein
MHWEGSCGTWHAAIVGKCYEGVSDHTFLISIDIWSRFVIHIISLTIYENCKYSKRTINAMQRKLFR